MYQYTFSNQSHELIQFYKLKRAFFVVCGAVPRSYQENWSEIEKSLDKTVIGMSGAEIVVHLRYIYFCNCPLKCIADMGKCFGHPAKDFRKCPVHRL